MSSKSINRPEFSPLARFLYGFVLATLLVIATLVAWAGNPNCGAPWAAGWEVIPKALAGVSWIWVPACTLAGTGSFIASLWLKKTRATKVAVGALFGASLLAILWFAYAFYYGPCPNL
jgi:hypothetical protein